MFGSARHTGSFDPAGNQTGNDTAGQPPNGLRISYLPTNQTQSVTNDPAHGYVPVTMTWTGAGQSERVGRNWTVNGTSSFDTYTYSPLGLTGRTTNTPNTPASSQFIRDPYGTPIAERNSDGTEYSYLFDGQGNVVGWRTRGRWSAATTTARPATRPTCPAAPCSPSRR